MSYSYVNSNRIKEKLKQLEKNTNQLNEDENKEKIEKKTKENIKKEKKVKNLLGNKRLNRSATKTINIESFIMSNKTNISHVSLLSKFN